VSVASVPRRFATLVAVLVALGSAACNGGGDDATSTTAGPRSTTTEATTTTAAPTATTAFVSEEAVVAANRAAWDAWFAAQNPPNPDLPALGATHTQFALVEARQAISGWLDRGIRFETQILDLVPRVVELTPERALLTTCITSSNTSYRLDTGAVDEQEPRLEGGFRMVMVPENGAWKWSERGRDESACVSG
jgi:hypothetical protein